MQTERGGPFNIFSLSKLWMISELILVTNFAKSFYISF